MSVIVKGMDMPTSCECLSARCPLFRYDEWDGETCGYKPGWTLHKRSYYEVIKPDWCPLVDLVRCEDCIHAIYDQDGNAKYCNIDEDEDGRPIRKVSNDYYCAEGKRYEEDVQLCGQ